MKQIVIIGILIACFSLSATASANKNTPVESQAAIVVKTAKVESKVWVDTISAFGEIIPDPDRKTVVAATVDGAVRSVTAYPGQLAAQGDPLITLEPGPIPRSQYQQAIAAQSYAQKQLEHVRKLMNEQLTTRDQVAAAERELSDAESQVAALQSQGAGDGVVVLRAPTSGVVTDIVAQTGEIVSTGTILLTLADRTFLMVRLGVEAEDALQIKPDASVTIETVLGPKVGDAPSADAQIVSLSEMVDPQSRLVEVVALINDPNKRFLIGQTVSGVIELQSVKGIVMPRAALLYEDDQAYAYVVEKGIARRRDISVLAQTDESVLVGSGLTAGEIVIVDGMIGLSDGINVEVSKK